MTSSTLNAMQDLIERYNQRRTLLLDEQQRLRAADLPLKFLRQQAHFTAPASEWKLIAKAVEQGASPVARILGKFGITSGDLADRLGVPIEVVDKQFALDPAAPLVLVDGEDAQALRDDVVLRGRENAVKAFQTLTWGSSLRFYRPSGLNLDSCMEDIVLVLSRVAEGRRPEDFPLDGMIWPKPDHPGELSVIDELLSELERRLGLPANRIRLQFLIESGWAVENLPDLVKPVMGRLCGIIFGIADYSADIGLSRIVNDHPVCDYARAAMVNIAGAVGVPAIDNMTVNYPVADASLTMEQNKQRILDRLKEVFDDALHGQALGMSGKWVGHPLQLFVVRLAFQVSLDERDLRQEVAKIEAYNQSVEEEKGATIIDGVMSDRATDRQARDKLRRAIAQGAVDTQTGLRLKLISEMEAKELEALNGKD